VLRLGPQRASTRVLVVGCIHGNECAGIRVVRWLEHRRRPRGVDIWTIEDLNPDGFSAGMRQNAHGVDLNRNFPWHWRRIGRPGSPEYSGPHPLSEPETRFVAGLIEQVEPQITIWFHQALGVVDESGGRIGLERRYARLVGLPLRRLPRYPGSASSWQNHLYPNTSFVVELPAGPLSPTAAARYGAAVLELAASAAGNRG
jgi:protein MpaA